MGSNIISLVLLNAESNNNTIDDYTKELFDITNGNGVGVNGIQLKDEEIREKLRSILLKICYNHYYYSLPKINKEWSERKYQQLYIAQNLINNEYQIEINNMNKFKYIINSFYKYCKDSKLKNIKENFEENLKYWDVNNNFFCLNPSKPLET